jgi:8-oxo-dGTP diphosphatase
MALYTNKPTIVLAVDCVVFGLAERQLQVMLIKRGIPPFQDQWALPGGFVLADESLDDAARRELWEETGIQKVFLEQLYTFGRVDRDPRGRVVSVAYYALIDRSRQIIRASTDASHAQWFAVPELPSLAFDHDQIFQTAMARLRGKVRYEPIGFELLPPKFTLTELQHLYELILGKQLDKRNFRKKILSMGVLTRLEVQETVGRGRASQLFSFNQQKYKFLKEKGVNFEI